jgi:hypothetical protein
MGISFKKNKLVLSANIIPLHISDLPSTKGLGGWRQYY